MKIGKLITAILIIVSSTVFASSITLSSFEYFHPRANSKYVSRETNIAIRQGAILDRSADLDNIAHIEGDISGLHRYDALISDDNKTLILKPVTFFEPGETVRVILNRGLKTIDNQSIGGLHWQFTISANTEKIPIFGEHPEIGQNEDLEVIYYDSNDNYEKNIALNDVSIPSNFPNRTVLEVNNPDSGYIFLSNFYGADLQFLMILDNDASPIYYRRVPQNTFDFKKQPNGLLTYYTYYTYQFYAMDSTYTVVDSFQCGNGYEYGTDPHDLQILPNGHALIMAYDPQTIDMSEIVECGDDNALVIGLIIQELDTLKNVVWEWNGWNYFDITDATWDINLCSYRIDYVHGNAVELDFDQNLLLSSRNLDEITKIDRTTGDIIWRWGGENNEFTFANDPVGFSHQHDIRRLPNGNLTMYDNGLLHTPQVSRALEYQLDEVNKVATLIWEFRQTPDVLAGVMGNAQRLASGNTVIGWGSARPNVTEVRQDSVKAFEMQFNSQVISYRAFRFPWHGVAARPYLIAEVMPMGIRLLFNKFGDSSLARYYVYMDTLPEPAILFDSSSTTSIEITDVFNETYYFRVTGVDSTGNESDFSNEVTVSFGFRYYYLVGDANMRIGEWPPRVIGSDVTYLVNFFKGQPENPPCFIERFYASADANGDCEIIGSDVTRLVNYFRGITQLDYCPDYPADWLSSDDIPEEPPEGWPNCEDPEH